MTEKEGRQGREGLDWCSEWTGATKADIKCKSWNGFINFLHDENALKQKQGYVFRGHASEKWKLEPTLKRAFSGSTGNQNLNKFKDTTLDSFKKFCLGRRGHNPPKLSENEWWALGQHYGLNTPLLDWTESPYVAAFFAFNSINHDSKNVVIWLLSKSINTKPDIDKLKKENQIEFMTPYLDENSRLINQRGLFIISPSMVCLNEWTDQIIKESTIDLARVLIPVTEKDFALDSLDKMNVNDLTLFPDLSGAAKYSNYIANRTSRK